MAGGGCQGFALEDMEDYQVNDWKGWEVFVPGISGNHCKSLDDLG